MPSGIADCQSAKMADKGTIKNAYTQEKIE